MRVAIFSPTIDTHNGYGNFTYEYCTALKETGTDFTLFLPRSEARRLPALALTLHAECILPENIFRVFQLRALGYLRIIDLSGFDLVHSLFEFPYCILAARAAKRAHLPLLIGIQGTYAIAPLAFFPEKYLLRWSYRRAQHILASSVRGGELLEKYAGEKFPIKVIHNGVNVERFQHPGDLSTLRKQYKGKRLVVILGGLKERKGQDLLLRALPAILKEEPATLALFIGEGPCRTVYERLSDTLGISASVRFLGDLPNQDVVNYLHLCELFVLTTRMYHLNFEGFGMVYLEAGACRKPVVATDAGGVRDAVRDGETGIIVPLDDVEAIAAAVVTLLKDHPLAHRMGDAGYAYARAHDWPRVLQKFIDIYRWAVH